MWIVVVVCCWLVGWWLIGWLMRLLGAFTLKSQVSPTRDSFKLSPHNDELNQMPNTLPGTVAQCLQCV